MKLMLVAIHIEPSPRALPLGPAMLASVLHATLGEAIETVVMDAFLADAPEACAAKILASDPDLVGFSMYVWNRPHALQIAAHLKAAKPGIVIFAGGAEATADVSGVLADPSVDFVLPGEGEDLIVEAMKRLLAGVAPADLAAWAKNSPVMDLAKLPSPFLDGTLQPEHYGGALWELSRGCPFACDFCFESRGTAGVRRIPMARVEAELELFEARGIRQVFVLDPTFNFHKAQAKQILRLIAKKAPDIHFFFEIRSEFIDREMAELFSAIRCTLQIGLQSAHDAVLRNISRSFNAQEFESKLLLLHQAGVPYGFDLIYGLPGDNLKGFKKSVNFAMSLVPNHLDIFRLSVLPGTRLADTACGLGVLHEAQAPYHVTATSTFNEQDMLQAARIARACDVLYNHGKAVPWFEILLTALEMKPSQIFEKFSLWTTNHPEATQPETELAEVQLIEAQQAFFQALFEAKDEPMMGALASDIIAYFGHVAVLLDGAESNPQPRRVAFQHDPQVLMEELEAGTTHLEELVFRVPAQPCEVEFSLNDGELVLRVL